MSDKANKKTNFYMVHHKLWHDCDEKSLSGSKREFLKPVAIRAPYTYFRCTDCGEIPKEGVLESALKHGCDLGNYGKIYIN